MDLIRKSIPDELLKVAIPPNPEGTEELAWPVSMAKRIIAYVYMGKLAVLGGDIYVKDGSQLNPAYDNWSCDIEHGEKWGSYVKRSNSEALEYLSNSWLEETKWFVLVVSDKPDAQQLARSYAR